MLDFNFCVSTNFIFGKDAHKKIGEVVSSYGVKKVMLVYDSGDFLKTTGLLDTVLDCMKASGLEVTELTGVLPNPRLGLVHEGVALGRKNQVEMVVSVKFCFRMESTLSQISAAEFMCILLLG